MRGASSGTAEKPAKSWLTSWRPTAATDNLLVLGLARGGVPVGWEVASFLQAPLDVFLVRKLGVPQWQELAMGALATGGGVVVNDNLVRNLGISDEQLQTAIARETDGTPSPRERLPRRPTAASTSRATR